MDSFSAEFDGLYAKAYRLAYRILGERAEAEEVAAEACTRAYSHWRRISKLSYRDAWLLRVASNLAIDSRRRRSRRLPIIDPPVSSEDLQALRIALVEALRALPRRQREAVSLRYLADLREAEVADLLGLSRETVKTHVRRGLTTLRKRLGDDFSEEARGV
jgi:RNA polymerase sigma-70 factor (ECF subfamily)